MSNNILIGIQPIIDIISLSLQSVFLSGEKNGVSLVLISKPESAKTSSIFQFSNLDFVSYYDEVTQKMLVDDFLPKVKIGSKKTLLIPDLINCIEKQKNTRNQFLSMIKSGTDDTGVVRISTFHKQFGNEPINYELSGIRFNVITAITMSQFQTIERYIRNTGLLSRFMPFSFGYPIDKIKDIFGIIEGVNINENIISGNRQQQYSILGDVKIPQIVKIQTIIKGDPSLFRDFEIISNSLGNQYGGYGLRAQVNLQRLAKANALLSGRDYVDGDDIKKIIHLSNWMNLNFNNM